ncbi:DUF4062 domain-containing protein [Chelativorans xinjiangense]|uniref:DUF4062 domain-containing protein n=1 Tax=Chelativorans xinjiangense TaxID=2681485 RepID=UPI0013583368|nr:DUF4062 domain-containing protein [Chelativorans xinjiangense]
MISRLDEFLPSRYFPKEAQQRLTSRTRAPRSDGNILSDSLKLIRIFIGSPGGLDEERQAAHDVVKSVNRSHSERWGLHFKLLGWENAVPGYVRPQSKLNEDLDRCDYFIGVLWNKWGSRPSTDPGGYTSGFEEEYFRAKMRIENGLMKDMAIYFKEIEVPAGMEPGEEVRKVFDFRQKCIDQKKVFFKVFSDGSPFRDVVREKLEEIGWRETELFSGEDREINQPKKTPSVQQNSNEPPARDAWLLDEEARTFLNDLKQRSPDWESTSPYEVARLRLIGTALSRSGNDDFYLGNHDANLIFQKFRKAILSKQELRALIDCGVMGFQHQNVPLWRWLAKIEDEDGHWGRIKVLAAVGNESEKKHSIAILILGSQPIPSLDEFLDKKRVLTSWLSNETDSQVFDAAVSFLASNADKDDLSLIEEVATQCSPYRRTKVEEAVVGILSRTSLDAALKRLVEKEVDKIDATLADVLFGSPQSLATATVLSCLSAKSDSIRLRAVQVLFARNEITLEAAETLLTDSNHEIRLLAAESLKKMGRELGDDVAKKALRIVKPSNNLVGLFGNKTDDTYYERYCVNRLAELDFSTLRAKAQDAGVFDDRELSVLYSKYPSKMQGEIRENLKDCFKGHFDKRIQEGKYAGIIDSDTESRIRKLETFHRRQLCTHALTALCGLGKTQDLDLLRNVLKEVEVDATDSILKYFSRFGDWSDIERVKNLGDYPSDRNRTGLLDFYRTKLPDQKAAAIFTLGKDRVADMLAIDIDSSIRISLAKRLPQKVFVDLRDEVLLRELQRKDDEYRIVFALRCVQALPKSRVTTLLDRYVDSGEHRFYNSVHWLDLGAALPSRLAKNIAERALSQH